MHMRIDLQPFEVWEELNSEVARELRTGDEVTVRAYPGLASAIFEITQGTAQFYSHKKSIALVAGRNPYIPAVLPYFYKEGYSVQIAPDNGSLTEWLETLNKDTAFVILCEDHAVTGELYPIDDAEKLLNEKRIFCFKVSHSNHLYRDVSLQPYSVRICSYTPHVCVAMVGNRLKAPALTAPYLDWKKEAFLQSLKQCRSTSFENQIAVEKIERNLPQGYLPLLTTQSRSFDRALIYSKEAGGECLQRSLASALKISLREPGWETVLETTHLCRWGGTRSYETWWNSRPEESILRGLLILSVEVLEHPGMGAFLEEALRECQIADFA